MGWRPAAAEARTAKCTSQAPCTVNRSDRDRGRLIRARRQGLEHARATDGSYGSVNVTGSTGVIGQARPTAPPPAGRVAERRVERASRRQGGPSGSASPVDGPPTIGASATSSGRRSYSTRPRRALRAASAAAWRSASIDSRRPRRSLATPSPCRRARSGSRRRPPRPASVGPPSHTSTRSTSRPAVRDDAARAPRGRATRPALRQDACR